MTKIKQWIFASVFTVMLTPLVSADLSTPITNNVVVDLSNMKRAGNELSAKQPTGIAYEFFPQAMLVLDDSSDTGETLGPYKVVPEPNALPDGIASNSLVIAPFAANKIVVRGRQGSRLGLADGEMLIKPKLVSDREVIVQQYALDVTSVLADGQFFTVRVTDISELPSVFSALSANPLVEEADLSVNYFDQVTH
jgi:hypothetical protein